MIMNTVEDRVIFVHQKLERDRVLPGDASEIAYNIYALAVCFKLTEEVEKLKSDFVPRLLYWNLENILETQINYAIRLADFSGKLEYEEMHKLFSLCDEIYALEFIGLTVDDKKKMTFLNSLRNRFKLENKKAKLVCEDKVEDWKKDLWWYKENL